jgi:hypothetical protein
MKTTKQRYCCILALALPACGGSSFSSDFRETPDGASSGGLVSASMWGLSSTGGTQGSKAGSGGRGTGGLPEVDAGGVSSTGGSATGGALTGSGGACQPQPCANDGKTCGTVGDGCGFVAKCLHQCAAAEQCTNATHECTCVADRVCPVVLADQTQCVNPCCAADGSCGCGVGLGTTSCLPAGKCTWTEQGSPKGLCDTSLFVWQCPGRGPPDPSCQLGTAATGSPYYCCGKLSY